MLAPGGGWRAFRALPMPHSVSVEVAGVSGLVWVALAKGTKNRRAVAPHTWSKRAGVDFTGSYRPRSAGPPGADGSTALSRFWRAKGVRPYSWARACWSEFSLRG